MVTIESNCPGCNKKVKAFIIDPMILSYSIPDGEQSKPTLAMLGCPECNNIFYKRDD